ncbi:MAG: hypothetical protein JNM17_15895 [Archangium sp.]|nr:hypothetical protein [Archangium sp.]
MQNTRRAPDRQRRSAGLIARGRIGRLFDEPLALDETLERATTERALQPSRTS